MPRFVVVLICGASAAVCISLGIWQLNRHGERKELVAEYSRRLASQPVAIDQVAGDAEDLDNTPVSINGKYDLRNEFLLTNRTRRGAPGVSLFTPVLRDGNDTAVLVNRGWAYSPDGSSLDVAQWRAGIPLSDSAQELSVPLQLRGLLLHVPDAGGSPAGLIAKGKMSRLSRLAIDSLLPYPVAPVYIVLSADDTLVREGVPTPLPPPVMSNGPHLLYAMQWFSFAIISVVGAIVLLRRDIAGRDHTQAIPEEVQRRDG